MRQDSDMILSSFTQRRRLLIESRRSFTQIGGYLLRGGAHSPRGGSYSIKGGGHSLIGGGYSLRGEVPSLNPVPF